MKPLISLCRIGPMIALILIGIGTGGIKPCVAAFGADQFRPEQVRNFPNYDITLFIIHPTVSLSTSLCKNLAFFFYVTLTLN